MITGASARCDEGYQSALSKSRWKKAIELEEKCLDDASDVFNDINGI